MRFGRPHLPQSLKHLAQARNCLHLGPHAIYLLLLSLIFLGKHRLGENLCLLFHKYMEIHILNFSIGHRGELAHLGGDLAEHLSHFLHEEGYTPSE